MIKVRWTFVAARQVHLGGNQNSVGRAPTHGGNLGEGTAVSARQ